MTSLPAHARPAITESLALWHDMVAQRDLTRLASIVHPEAVFRSPIAFTAYAPAPALILALSTVVQVFEDFVYLRQLASDDGLDIALEFSARIGEKKLKGVDLIRFDAQGRIVEFEVLIRPLSGLQALAAEMGTRLGQTLPAFKVKS